LITKNGGGIFYINANSGGYRGIFEQSAGKTIVSSSSFGGAHNISSGSVLEFATGSAFTSGSSYALNNATMTISANNNLTFDGQIKGTAQSEINKTGNGILTLTGNNGGYKGTFTQHSGKTVVSSVSFGGKHIINNGGELEFATGSSFADGSSYALNDSSMTISANSDLTFKGEVGGNGVINKTGDGKLTLEGNVSFANGTFNARNGELAFANQAGYTGKALNADGAVLNMQNNSADEIKAGKFTSNTNLKIDIFSGGSNDKITAALANIGGNIDIKAGVGSYNNISYDLIIATGGAGSLSGVFISSSINNPELKYELIYINDIVRLVINGVLSSRFSDLGNLTYNQTQTAQTFDKMSPTSTGDWNKILSQMNNKKISGTAEDIAEVKSFLAHTSGYFLANVVRNAAADSPSAEIYDKIRNHLDEYKTNGGLWIQAKGGTELFKEDKNSIKDYKDLSLGVMFGYDRFVLEKVLGGDLTYGIYARINKDTITQGLNKADGNKNGIGVYGGYAWNMFELKAMLLGSYDKFSLEREVMGAKAKSDINAVTLSADIEGALKISLSGALTLKPYLGLEIANTMYGAFKERNAGIYNLDTRKGHYLRSAARIGAGLDYEKGKWIWYANAEGKYLIDGNKPEIKSVFENTDIEFYSRGSQEGRVALGAGVGAEKRISKHWKLFANAKYYFAERYESISGNIGVRYLFGKAAPQKAVEEPKIEKEIQIEKEIAAAKERRKKAIKAFTLKVHFNTNIYTLTPKDIEYLSGVAEEMKEYEFKKITIEGHTDSTGKKEFNRNLSRQRAKSVYEEFIKAGIPEDKISYVGFADEIPVDDNKTKAGRAANRRTEVFIE
jgi:outer membrane protein OmpA-like peptidoglycan-associated protein